MGSGCWLCSPTRPPRGDPSPSSCGAVHSRACPPVPRPYRNDPGFNPDFIKSKSTAAAGLCSWCLNMVRFYEVHCVVKPKRQAVADADAELAEAQQRLSRIKSKIVVSVSPHSHKPLSHQMSKEPCEPRAWPKFCAGMEMLQSSGNMEPPIWAGKSVWGCSLPKALNENLAHLTAQFEKATAEKIKCQQEADETNKVISLANRYYTTLALKHQGRLLLPGISCWL